MDQAVTKPAVTRVWITSGCIVCGLCEDTCPEVFDVRAEGCIVKGTAERHYDRKRDRIAQAADECPVSVIRVGGHNEPA